jgi:hypothetical protein
LGDGKRGKIHQQNTGGFGIFWILSTIKSWSKGKTWDFSEGKLGCEESIMSWTFNFTSNQTCTESNGLIPNKWLGIIIQGSSNFTS